jgi:uncharacterized protein YkwD
MENIIMNRHKKVHWIVILFVLVILIVSSIPTQVNVVSNASAGKYGDIAPTSYEFELLNKINENRSANSAPPLKLNSTLWWVARAHSQDMIDNDFFDHTSSQQGPFNGATFRERVNDHAEYQNTYVGECIAVKSSGIDVEWCMSAWKNSPPHWDIIINPNLKEAGIGILVGNWDGYPNSALYTADFGGPGTSVDLVPGPSGIQFDPLNPDQGDVVNIAMTVENSGNTDAYPVNVKFYDGDPASGGVEIGDETVPHILVHGESTEVSMDWDTQGESGIHDIHVVIDEGNVIAETDENNNGVVDSISINAPNSPIHLDHGWNLVSFPYIVSNEDIGSVLSSISGKFDVVQYYDTSDSNDPWKNHITHKPDGLNDLNQLDNKIGFLIHVTDSNGADLTVSGDVPTSPQAVPLKAGWNLVGYPSATQRSRDLALNNLEFDNHIDVVQYYDTTTNSFLDLDKKDDFQPGVGYWVHATQDCDWMVIV